ncbi:MAG: FAD-dependent 5-carboxymethylaminomethyl-2-thiouridine(34) oxidoreductase MnmC, partial [Burkholderiales bacterium]|nr:FAD-dependent 5-carboxymethylaminomethyl-2-thiouridine(34) oxidoreductase MnmC [Burkholderiales bacterium]
ADHPGLQPLAARLQAAWPELVPGMHRLHFESGRVTLTLVFAEAAAALAQLHCSTDAFFLDGFAPDRNAGMWTPEIMKHCARLAAADATLATYSTARPVRDALEAAGFSVRRQPGYGRKHHMLAARRRMPAWAKTQAAADARESSERHAMVIGAGVAGAAACERLAARGWRITLIDRAPGPAGGASGLHAGIVHPHVSSDDCLLSRLSRNGFLYNLSAWRALEQAGHALSWQRCGVARPAEHGRMAQKMRLALEKSACPAGYAEYLDREALAQHCGYPPAHGGYWFPQGGWMQPASLVHAQLTQSRAETHFGRHVDRLVRRNHRWHALAADGAAIAEAPVAVIANSADATRLIPIGHHLQRVRGQLTRLPPGTLPGLRCVVAGKGYVLPPVAGISVAGSTYDLDDDEAGPTPAGHRHNLASLEKLLPGIAVPADPGMLDGSVGFRAIAADRMPLIGAMPDMDAIRLRQKELRGARLKNIPRLPGLYGAFGYASRGLNWAALGGELIASLLDDEPLPLEKNLADAIDPARGAMKRLRWEEII